MKHAPMPQTIKNELTAPAGHTGPGQPVDLTGPKQGAEQKLSPTVRTPNTTGGRYK